MYYKYYQGDRQFFVPFLLGGLAGGAAVGLSRPRPIYNVHHNKECHIIKVHIVIINQYLEYITIKSYENMAF